MSRPPSTTTMGTIRARMRSASMGAVPTSSMPGGTTSCGVLWVRFGVIDGPSWVGASRLDQEDRVHHEALGGGRARGGRSSARPPEPSYPEVVRSVVVTLVGFGRLSTGSLTTSGVVSDGGAADG